MVSYNNRYGVKIVADLYSPRLPFRDRVTGLVTNGPFPGLVLVPGSGSEGNQYEGVAQSLAEAGYVVLAFDPQGQGRSGIRPDASYCTDGGAWQQPQEAGLVEQGRCAGVPPPLHGSHSLTPLVNLLAGTPLGPQVDVAGQLVEFRTNHDAFLAELEREYAELEPNYVFGALDAHDYLVSNANPLRSIVDPDRVGVLGHSLGASGSVIAANGDPQQRFAAAVGFDGYGSPPAGAPPTVPTMFIAAEGIDLDYPMIPEPDLDNHHPGTKAGAKWRASEVDAMQISLRGSTHMEWYYFPYRLANPVTGPFVNASSEGEVVSVYYMQAWFDLQLKGATHGVDAMRRLTAKRFDNSADRSSIGTGRYDPIRLKNQPYTIAGERRAQHLSPLLRSAYDIDGIRCVDMFTGC